MRKFIGLLLLVVIAYGEYNLDDLSESQAKVFRKTFNYGSNYKESVLMSAIAWQESSFGLNLVSNRECFGVFQNAPKYICIGMKQNNAKCREIIGNKLLSNFDYSYKESRKNLLWWNKYYRKKGLSKRNLLRMSLASYNAGFNAKYFMGQEYAREVIHKIKMIESYLRKKEKKWY